MSRDALLFSNGCISLWLSSARWLGTTKNRDFNDRPHDCPLIHSIADTLARSLAHSLPHSLADGKVND